MKTYAALGATSKQHLAVIQAAEYPNLLWSFFYEAMAGNGSEKTALAEKSRHWETRVGYEFPNLLLDSGAFSAVTLGKEIPLDEYIQWALDYGERVPNARVTNLDVIPSRNAGTTEFNWVPTRSEITRCCKQGAKNAEKIRAAGLRVIEVYHLFEPIQVWRDMIERRQEGEMLGIGGLGFSTWGDRKLRRLHGDACFAVIKEMCGWDAVPPIHAFGGVTDDIPWRYPIASCDASSWIAPARWGQRSSKGRKMKRAGADRHQLLNKDMANGECIKILEGWKIRDEQVAKHWEHRGVHFLPEGPANVSRPVVAA